MDSGGAASAGTQIEKTLMQLRHSCVTFDSFWSRAALHFARDIRFLRTMLISRLTHEYQLCRSMSPSARNFLIYLFIAVSAFLLTSRAVTVALMLMYAAEDAEPFFFPKQIFISIICVGLILWLWSKRSRQRTDANGEE